MSAPERNTVVSVQLEVTPQLAVILTAIAGSFSGNVDAVLKRLDEWAKLDIATAPLVALTAGQLRAGGQDVGQMVFNMLYGVIQDIEVDEERKVFVIPESTSTPTRPANFPAMPFNNLKGGVN